MHGVGECFHSTGSRDAIISSQCPPSIIDDVAHEFDPGGKSPRIYPVATDRNRSPSVRDTNAALGPRVRPFHPYCLPTS